MRIAGRAEAAIEILTDIATHHRPASLSLADWGRSHRFAGSGDRAAIANLVYDALRQRASVAARMGDDVPRALVLGTLVAAWGLTNEQVGALCDGSKFAPKPLSPEEVAALARPDVDRPTPPDHVRADVPEWLWPSFSARFEDEAVREGEALASRAPLDLRANTLKADRPKVEKALARFAVRPCPISPLGLRIAAPEGAARTPNVKVEGAFQKGWFEVQDEGSQVMAALTFAQPGEQALDFCAGGGGKTLALSAAMANKGQVFAFDRDRQRLAPIYDRLKRAGARNVQIRPPGDGALDDLAGRMHRVLVDAPCTGSGIWRRRPDAKWRLTPEALEKRSAEQHEVLGEARAYVRPGGYLCYVTCSVLAEENENQVYRFLEENPDFELVSAEEAWRELFGDEAPRPWSGDEMSLLMTPKATGTDGFYFAVMERRAAE